MRIILTVGVVLLLGVLSLRMSIPAYVVSPGPVFPLAGAVSIDGVEAINGDFLFTTIQLNDAQFVDLFTTTVRADEELVSRASVLQGEAEADFIARQEALFDEAEEQAISIGLALAGSDVDVEDVMIETDGVGGPSAGLLTALAVADLASPRDVAGGRVIAGSGTLDADGVVGPVGGIEDKVRAAAEADATVFLVPPDLVEQASAMAPSMDVIGVSTVTEAFDALSGTQ